MHTRGLVLQRIFSHDVYHCGELSQTHTRDHMGVLLQCESWRLVAEALTDDLHRDACRRPLSSLRQSVEPEALAGKARR